MGAQMSMDRTFRGLDSQGSPGYPSQGSGSTGWSLLLVAYFIAKPFYLFASGTAQIADGFIGLLFLFGLISGAKLTSETTGIFRSCVIFCIYAFFVNAIWALILNDLSMLKAPVFYAFDVIVLFVVLAYFALAGEQAIKTILFAVVASLAIQFALAILFKYSGFVGAARSTLFFNNPNQLGYWTLLSASAFCVLSRSLKVRTLTHLAVFALSFFLVAISLGKAASIALSLLFFLHFGRKPWHFILASTVALIAIVAVQELSFITNLVDRLSGIGSQSDDSIAGRGYNRIWNHPEYLLFGAGEFGLSRFPGEIHELHSTLGTLLFGYGAIGAFLFAVILLRLLKRAGISNFLYLAPAFVYGLTHQGLRFSLLWVLFAALAIVGRPAAGGVSPGLSSSREPGENGADTRYGDKSSFRAPP